MPLGYSYAPTQPNANIPGGAPNRAGGPAGVQPQSPARILSLRLPRQVGPTSPIPQGLLTAQGAAGSPDLNMLIAMLLRSMQPGVSPQGLLGPERSGQGSPFGGMGGGGPLAGAGSAFPSGGGGGGGLGPIPPPRFVPGDEGRQPAESAYGAGNRQPAPAEGPSFPSSPDSFGGSLGFENFLNNRGLF